VERSDDGLTHVKFIFKDNGRGPEINETIRYNPDHTMAEFHAKGTSTFGAPIDENFERKGDEATWWSTSEKGSKHVTGPAFYVALNSSWEAASAAITALAERPDNALPLLPTGTLSQKK